MKAGQVIAALLVAAVALFLANRAGIIHVPAIPKFASHGTSVTPGGKQGGQEEPGG